jgi:uncharacterized membrane protein YfcA
MLRRVGWWTTGVVALLAGILPGSLAGVALSRRVSTGALRIALGVLILAACGRMALDLVR